MAHAQKPDSVFQRNGRVHLYRRGCQFSRVLAFLECGSGENDCSSTGWTVPSQNEACLATHSIRLFPLHFSSRASPCATRFRFHSTDCTAFYALDILHPVVGFTTATVAFTDREINWGPNTVGLRHNLILHLGLHPVYRAMRVRGAIIDTENDINTHKQQGV